MCVGVRSFDACYVSAAFCLLTRQTILIRCGPYFQVCLSAQSPCNAGETKDGYCQPLEKAEIVREGRDVTILCYSRMRYVVMQAVQQLEKQGFDPEARPLSRV